MTNTTISNYTDLRSEIVNWLFDRSDIQSKTPQFIELAENVFNHGNTNFKPLRVREMETEVQLTLTDSKTDLPADYLGWRSVSVGKSPIYELEFVTPTWINKNYPWRGAGYPQFFTVSENQIEVIFPSSSTVYLKYYQRIPALSDAAPTNWLLQKYPNAYLFAAASFGAGYLGDRERQAELTEMALGALQGLHTDDKSQRWSKAAIALAGPVP